LATTSKTSGSVGSQSRVRSSTARGIRAYLDGAGSLKGRLGGVTQLGTGPDSASGTRSDDRLTTRTTAARESDSGSPDASNAKPGRRRGNALARRRPNATWRRKIVAMLVRFRFKHSRPD
jgi:hypothetical protein